MRAYQVVNGWQSRQLVNVEGIKPFTIDSPHAFTTESFTFETCPWAMVWSLRGTELKVSVNNSQTNSQLLAQVAMDFPQGGQGISYIYETGTFDLEIDARGDWTIKVASVEEVNEVT